MSKSSNEQAKKKTGKMSAPYVKTAAAACLTMSAMIAGTVSFGFFMDPVTRDLGFDRSTFSLYFSLITIVGTVTLPVYGKLIARFGSRPFVKFGGIWTGLTMAALSFCTTLPMFYVVGCLIGLGFFGCSYAVVPVVVNAWFVERNGFVMGAAAACGGVVAMVLSLVFPLVIESMGWKAGYVLLGVVVFALTTPVGVFLLRSKPADMGLEPFGANAGAAVADVADAAGAQTETEATSDAPELPGVPYAQALKMPQLWAILVAFLLLAITVTITQHLAAYFVSVGFDAIMAGVFMSVISAGLIFTSSGAGVVADKLGLVKTLFVCSALYLASFLLLPASPLVPVICVALVLMSIGNANTSVFAPMVTNAAFGQREYAAIWGLVSMANVLGQAIGAPLWGLAFDLTGSYVPGMYVSAVIVAVAFLMLAWASKPKAASR